MSVVNRSLIAKRLKPGLAQLLGMDYARYSDQHLKIYDKRISNKAVEEMVMTVGMGLAPVKGEGAHVFMDNVSDAYTVRVEHSAVSIGYAITREAIDDNLYATEGEAKTAALARSMGQTKEVRAAGLLNNGFSGSFTFGDGQPIFSASHPLANGSTGDNTDTADISEASIKASQIAISAFVDDRGLKVQAKPMMLITTPSDAFTAFEILRSDLSTTTATNSTTGVTSTNNVNSIKGRGLFPQGHMVYDFLTDADSWFVKTDVPNGLMLWQRNPMTFSMDWTDPYTGNIVCTAYERYGFTIGDWRAMYGGLGA
jgi:hypothetical protein